MDLIYRLGWTLMHSLWEGAVLGAISLVVLGGASRRTARERYVVLMATMVAVLVSTLVTFALRPPSHTPIESVFEFGRSSRSSVVPVVFPTGMLKSPGMFAVNAPIPSPVTGSEASPVRKSTGLGNRIGGWIQAACPMLGQGWLVGVMLLGAWHVGAWFSVQRLRALSVEHADQGLLRTAHRLATALHVPHSFDVVISGFAETPMVVGWLRPVILFPASALTGLSAQQLEAILAHELAHILRHDYVFNLLLMLSETLLFYHPVVWLISRQIRLEREQACDDIALSVCRDRYIYAGSLAAIEELRAIGTPAMAAGGSGGKQMLARIRRILCTDENRPRWRLPALASNLLIILAIAVVMAMQLQKVPPAHAAPATQPFSLRNDAPRQSPLMTGSGEEPRHREQPKTQPALADDLFRFDIAFKEGRTEFLGGDQITVTSVRGTSADLQSGICCITGTYRLSSHDHAILAASVTAAEDRDASGPWNATQNSSIQKGTGPFKLLLPISIRGWPHIGIYGSEIKSGNAAESDESEALKKTIDAVSQDLANEEQSLARKNAELDTLAERYGTSDLGSRDQQLQAVLATLEGETAQAQIAREAAKRNPSTEPTVEVSKDNVESLQKLLSRTRASASEVSAQRMKIESVRSEITSLQTYRERDLRMIEELHGRQETQGRLTKSAFGELYFGTGDWILRR